MMNGVLRGFRSVPALVAALLLGLSLLSGLPAVSQASDEGIRQPVGAVETFWDGFSWFDLTPDEQALWTVLGWGPGNWDGQDAPPASERKRWRELTETERLAAGKLGYDESSWDSAQ